MQIRPYTKADLPAMIAIWNTVVADGIAFPQEDLLDAESGAAFFASQTHCGVAEDDGGEVVGLYILHPNNIGRCGHIANASYAVDRNRRGLHIGEQLVLDSLAQAKAHGFGVMQFNAVVACNTHARHLYERLGFVPLGVIPKGFRMKDGHYEDICPYYHEL
jgi:L-amino acid N-acyltransferase YncA